MFTLHTASTPVRVATLAATSALFILALAACNSRTEPQPSAAAVQPATTEATPAVADARSDTLITADIKTTLLADDIVKGLDFGVSTDRGEVRLTGTIDNQAQRDQALVLTRRIEGVRLVRDDTTLRN